MSTFASPLAPVNPAADAVALEIARMLAAEGSYHVDGIYVPCVDRANRLRRLVAERTVAAAERRAAWLARNPVCIWCTQRIPDGIKTTLVAGETIGACCVADYEHIVFGAEPPVTMPTAPLDESDVLVIEAESGTEDAYGHGYQHGESVGEQQGAFRATMRELGRAA